MRSTMLDALAIAANGQYLTSPNPSIGCVLVDSHGNTIGQGHTQAAGQAHAEVMALRDADANGHLTNGKLPAGTTAYVTLEPCNHQGRTGPCSVALVQSGIAKVVAANPDPNPLVAGQGFAMLRAAGVEVELLDANHEHAIAARESYIGFWQRMTKGVPWVATVSDHAPDVRQVAAVGEDQVTVAEEPMGMEVGATESSIGRFTPSPTSSLNKVPTLAFASV